jgi:hypothetical protein
MAALSISNTYTAPNVQSGVTAGAAPGSSVSSSSSYIPPYSQSPFLQAIANYAGQVGSQVYDWAQQQYATNTALTNNNINSYLSTGAQALSQAQNDTSRYQNLFQPEENQLLQDANSYASPNRVKMEMGAAESGQSQAADANRQNAERDLQSFGIDPSSGRYAALDKAAAVSAAANEAGAAQQARVNTEATGRALRSEAIQVGERYPGQISNDLNTGLQATTGAQNAGLANSAAGVSLQGAADPYLNTASSLKYPPLGNTSQSASQSYPPVASNGSRNQPQQPQNSGVGAASGGGAAASPSGGGSQSPAGATPDPITEPTGAGDTSNPFGDPSATSLGNDPNTGSSSSSTYGDPTSAYYDPYSATGSLGDNTGATSSSTSGDPTSAYYDPYSATASTDTSGSAGSYDTSGGSYAQGGAIGDDSDGTEAIQTDGGAIPQSASPSGGQVTDDVRAQGPGGAINVNAHEFVIPQDVALWKGQEFFQKLIAQSRQMRATAPAHPQQRPQQAPQRPSAGMR